jgi:hypothetical protein
MLKFTAPVILLAGAMGLSSAAVACPSPIGPAYIGERSANPEQETYAYVVRSEARYLLGYADPARYVGSISGDPEKNTFAYWPLIANP